MTQQVPSNTKVIVNTSILIILVIFLQITPVILGRPFYFLSISSIIPLYLITCKRISYGFCCIVLTFFMFCLFAFQLGCLFLFTIDTIAITLGIAENKKYSKVQSILTLGLLLSATLICVEQFLGLPIFFIHSSNTMLYIGWAILFSIILSAAIHVIKFFLIQLYLIRFHE